MAEWALPHLEGEHYAFVDATDEGVDYIAQHLRESDREECFATFGHRHYAHTLRMGVASSDSAVMAITPWGEPVGLLGVGTLSIIEGIGCPWMVATPRADRHRRAFIACGRAYTRAMLEQYESLENHVDARNLRTIAWLRRIGFTVEDARPFGVFGAPFHPFRMRR